MTDIMHAADQQIGHAMRRLYFTDAEEGSSRRVSSNRPDASGTCDYRPLVVNGASKGCACKKIFLRLLGSISGRLEKAREYVFGSAR